MGSSKRELTKLRRELGKLICTNSSYPWGHNQDVCNEKRNSERLSSSFFLFNPLGRILPRNPLHPPLWGAVWGHAPVAQLREQSLCVKLDSPRNRPSTLRRGATQLGHHRTQCPHSPRGTEWTPSRITNPRLQPLPKFKGLEAKGRRCYLQPC